MTKIYNPLADQLKCNFCTQWFSCTMHFANIQRYSLNACKKCLENFHFTLVDSNTYKISRLLLFDTGLIVPKAQNPNNLGKNHSSCLQIKFFLAKIGSQLRQAEEDIKSKVSEYFQQQIQKIIRQLEQVQLLIEKECLKIKEEVTEEQHHQQTEILLQNSISRKINALKEITPQQWIKQPLSAPQTHQHIYKTKSKNNQSSGKENQNPINRVNCAQSIKSRILGFVPPLEKTNNKSKQSKQPPNAVARSISQTRSVAKSRRLLQSPKLQQSPKLHSPNVQQLERADIVRLLSQKNCFQSYMAQQTVKQQSVIKKQGSQRNMVEQILQLKAKSTKTGQLLQLVGGNAQKVNFDCYLRSLGSMQQLKTVRIIKSNLVDADFDNLLNFIGQHTSVQTLIVTNNRLTELSVNALGQFHKRHLDSKLTQVYFGNNFIRPNLTVHVCNQLHLKGLEVFL